MNGCTHNKLTCLNQYDLIRKYMCDDCKEIMMCKCDEEYGRRFLPHQLSQASWFGSRERVPVTIGFQKNACPECRGEKAIAAPKAQMHGVTTKVTRYYWREIYFESTKRFYNAHPDLDPCDFGHDESLFSEERNIIKKEVIDEIKKQHKINPKYEYSEVSQKEVIERTNTEVILLKAEYVDTNTKKVGIRNGNNISTIEEFGSDYFINKGYDVLEVESAPFHVLFGIFMFLVVQDVGDEKGRIVQFGNRTDFDLGVTGGNVVTMSLPDDFGSNLYYERQKELIKKHLNELEDIDWLFEYWTDHSSNLRQYLWAHRDKDVLKAKKVMSILGLDNLRKVLHYLIMNYWKNYCGWPDLLVFNDDEFFFVEVKSSNDKLSEDQKNWFLGNHEYMGFNAKIFKVGK